MRAPIKNLVALLSGLSSLSVASAEVPVTITYQEPLEQLQVVYPASIGEQQKASWDAFLQSVDERKRTREKPDS